MKWPICVQDGWYVMKNVSRYKQMQSNPVISFWSQSFKAVDFSQLVYFGRSVYSNTKKLLYTNFISLKNHNATWVRIASFWKEAVLLLIWCQWQGHNGVAGVSVCRLWVELPLLRRNSPSSHQNKPINGYFITNRWRTNSSLLTL